MKVDLQPFDEYGGNNEKGENIAVIVEGIEILDIWANGRISAPIGSPIDRELNKLKLTFKKYGDEKHE